MTYQGYFEFGGVELANAARSIAYARTYGFGALRGCARCDDLGPVLGQTYTGPSQDPAPWHDPGRRASDDFLGFYTTRVDGLDDSTREASLIDLVGDGTAVSRVRQAGREMRFEGVMLALTDEGLDAGLSWLSSTLDSYRCDGSNNGCEGGDLRFLSSCPEIDTVTATDTIVNWNGSNPAVEAANWTGHGGAVFNAGGSLNFAATTPPDGYVERTLTGLVSGQWYSVEVTLAGQGRVSIEASGTVVAMPKVHSNFTSPLPFQMEFLARSSTETLRIRGTGPISSLGSNLSFTGLVVKRTRPGSVVDQIAFTATNGGSSAFGAPYNLRPTTQVPFTLGFGIEGPVASQNPDTLRTYPSGVSIFSRRRVSGSAAVPSPASLWSISLGTLEPGNYRVDLWMHAQANVAAFAGTATYRAAVGAATSATIAATTLGSASMPTKYTVSFTMATEGEALLTISALLSGSPTFTTSDSIDIVPIYLQAVNLSAPVSVPQPDSTLKYWRTLHDVTAIAGPTVLDRSNVTCGVMARVTFGLVAGDPRKYKVERDLGRFPVALGPNVNTWRCRNGNPYRYNLLTNTTFETSIAGWTNGGTSGLPFVWNATAIDTTVGFGPGSARGGVSVAGQTLTLRNTFRIYASGWYHTMFAADGTSTYTVDVGSAAGLSDLASGVAVPVPGSTSGQVYFNFYLNTDPGGTTRTVHIQYRRTSTAVAASGSAILDAMLVGIGQYQRGDGWFGSRPGVPLVTWSQTEPPRANALTIGAEAFDATYMIEDEQKAPVACLRFPLAPQPPTFVDMCQNLPMALAYHNEIPVSAAALSTAGTVVPVLRFYMRDESAAQGAEASVNAIRMRWYRNPTGRPINELPPCAFEGEMTVANIPQNAWTVVDGARQTVHTESLPQNNDIFSVDIPQAAYGPDMGGVDWPELRCGEQYTLALDVDSGVETQSNVWPASYVEIGLVPVA